MTSDNPSEMLIRIDQNLINFKNHVTCELAEIKEQVKKTNGRVNNHDVTLAMLENNRLNCPARKGYDNVKSKIEDVENDTETKFDVFKTRGLAFIQWSLIFALTYMAFLKQ